MGGVVHTYIQSFHMPLFFIVSGYLWKSNNILTVAKKRFRTLLVPYLVFATIYFILNLAVRFLGYSYIGISESLLAICLFPTDMSNMPFSPSLWFLPCIFFTELFYTIISKHTQTMMRKGVVVGIITVIGLTYSSFDLPMLPWALETVATALLFWYVGELIHKNYAKISDLFNHGFVPVLILFCISIVMAFTNGCVDMRSSRYCIPPLYLINGILGTLAYWAVAYQWNKYRSFHKIIDYIGKFLQYLSVNAMAYLCMNQFFIMFCKIILKRISPSMTCVWVEIINRSLIFCITILLCTIMNILIRKTRHKYILGR